MSKLEELINQLCTDGVEYKSLIEIASKISSGGTPLTSNQEYYSGNIPWLRTQEVDWDDITDTSVKISEEAVKNSSAKWIPANCVIVAMYGATAAKVAVNKIPLTTNQACCNIEVDPSKALYRYVYYWLCNNYEKLKGMGQGSQSNINAGIVKSFPIPLPPLPVQEEIVRILDNMTSLTAELTVKLAEEKEARQKQYEYYRDSLMSFEEGNVHDGVRWMKLGEIGKVAMCKRILKQETSSEGDVPFYKIGTFGKEPDAFITSEKFEEYKNKYSYPNVGDILISAAGTIGRTVIFDGKPAYYQDSNIVWLAHDESIVLNKYLFYCYQLNPWAVSSGGTIARLYNDNINKAVVPVPPLEEQKRIVDILDRFDKLCNDISEGLPAEIEARKKQYEYYRDKLLTFKEKEA